jgi:Tfp pilus assembly protein PilW
MSKFLKVKRMYASNQKQQGMSLMGLLVGMLLSVLSILAAMTMYHNMVDVAIDTRQAAQHDAQLATAMQTIQLELQSAGYGITDAQANSELSASNDKQNLYWRYRDTSTSVTYTCRGVQYGGGTLALVKKSECGSLAESGSWDLVQVLAKFVNPPAITFKTDKASCFPYGRTTAAVHGLVTIEAQSAALLAGGVDIDMNVYDICLPNLS